MTCRASSLARGLIAPPGTVEARTGKKIGRAELGEPTPPGKYPELHLGEKCSGVTVDIGNRSRPIGSETT